MHPNNNEKVFSSGDFMCIGVFFHVDSDSEVRIVEFDLLHGFLKMVILLIFNSSEFPGNFLEISLKKLDFWKLQKISVKKSIGLPGQKSLLRTSQTHFSQLSAVQFFFWLSVHENHLAFTVFYYKLSKSFVITPATKDSSPKQLLSALQTFLWQLWVVPSDRIVF